MVDATGAGDAFIGGFLVGRYGLEMDAGHSLQLGCWVGGCKLSGAGARTALPTRETLENELGTKRDEIQQSLERLLQPFEIDPLPSHESWESVG